MDENIELLEYIYKNAEMGTFTLTTLINELNGKENKIKFLVGEELKGYEKFLRESKKRLTKNNAELKTTGFMAKMGSSMGIKKETKIDNSDSAIAHMLIEGINMGVLDITSKIKNYEKIAKKDVLNLAKEFLKFQENELEKLKEYL